MGGTGKGEYTVGERDGVAVVLSPEGDVVRRYPGSEGGETYAAEDADNRNGHSWG